MLLAGHLTAALINPIKLHARRSLNKQGQKRAEVAKKIINAIKTVEKVSGKPVSFYSYGDAGKDGAGNIHNGMSNNKVAPETP